MNGGWIWVVCREGGRGWRSARWEVGRLEAVDRNGIRFVTDLKEKGMGRPLEDFKRPSVGGSKGRMGGRGKDENHREGEKIDR